MDWGFGLGVWFGGWHLGLAVAPPSALCPFLLLLALNMALWQMCFIMKETTSDEAETEADSQREPGLQKDDSSDQRMNERTRTTTRRRTTRSASPKSTSVLILL